MWYVCLSPNCLYTGLVVYSSFFFCFFPFAFISIFKHVYPQLNLALVRLADIYTRYAYIHSTYSMHTITKHEDHHVIMNVTMTLLHSSWLTLKEERKKKKERDYRKKQKQILMVILMFMLMLVPSLINQQDLHTCMHWRTSSNAAMQSSIPNPRQQLQRNPIRGYRLPGPTNRGDPIDNHNQFSYLFFSFPFFSFLFFCLHFCFSLTPCHEFLLDSKPCHGYTCMSISMHRSDSVLAVLAVLAVSLRRMM